LAAGGQVVVLERKPNRFASSFATEIVRLGSADGTQWLVLCKYDIRPDGSPVAAPHGADYRESLTYEGHVYSQLLGPLRVSAPRFYGLYGRGDNFPTWLALEYADDGVWPQHTPSWEQNIVAAARWIGEFQCKVDERYGGAAPAFLTRRDDDFYRGWIRRASPCLRDWGRSVPWLPALVERYERAIDLLVTAPTVVHGEYYPQNILFRRRTETICPVDWQTAAIAAGELDLASLTDGYPNESVHACEAAYRQARWPAGAPADFEERLVAARLFWAIRWLAGYPWVSTNQAPEHRPEQRLERLRAAAEYAQLTRRTDDAAAALADD
jgi:hypothetical protein